MPNQRIFQDLQLIKKEQNILFGRYKSANFLEKIKRLKRTI